MNNFCGKVEAREFPAGMKVLVVDGDPESLGLHENTLTKLAYDDRRRWFYNEGGEWMILAVTTCSQAKAALKLLREKKGSFDLIFVDVNVPDMDCCILLKHIKEEMNLPSIMMLADNDKHISSIMQGIEHGACDFLIKPMNKERVQIIWHHVARKKYSAKMERLLNEEHGSSSDEAKKATEATGKSLKKRSSSEDESKTSVVSRTRPRFLWTEDRQQKFKNAITQIGLGNAVPKKILEVINDPEMTRGHVASHLQKYRMNLRKSEKKNAQDAYPQPIEPNVRMSLSGMSHIPNQSPGQPTIRESNQFPIQRSSSHLPHGQSMIFDRLAILQSNNIDYHQSNDSIARPSDQNLYFGAHNRNTMMDMESNWTQSHADFDIGYNHESTDGHHIPTTSYANDYHLYPTYFSNGMPIAQIQGGDANNIGPLSGQPASGLMGRTTNNISLLGGHTDSRQAHLLNENGSHGQQVENSSIIETSTVKQQPYHSNPRRGIDHESPAGLGFAGTHTSNPVKVESNEHEVLMKNVVDKDTSLQEVLAISNGFLTSDLHVGFSNRQEFP